MGILMLRAARLYLASAAEPAIIAALHRNTDGVCFEQESPDVLADWRDPAGLGAALRVALQRFSMHETDLRLLKKSDWPSFRASACRSVRAFEATYRSIWVRALNEAELFYDASMEPRGESDIALHVTVNRYGTDREFGRKLLKLFDVSVAWQPLP